MIQSAVEFPWGTEKVGSSRHSALELSQVCAANRATAESKGWWAQNRKESGPRTGRAQSPEELAVPLTSLKI